jgi:hypothetical protein
MNNYQKYATGLEVYSHLLQGQSAKRAGEFEAVQRYQNARQRIKSGVQEAQEYSRKGRQAVGSAKMAMIAQGGMVQPEMLAKLKKEYEIDAIKAMYDAKADALTQESAARLAKLQGKRTYRAQVYRAAGTLFGAM